LVEFAQIPQEAYDLTIEADRMRCWSPENVQPLSPTDNMQKGVQIIDELCIGVGVDLWPMSWHRTLPTQEQKQAFYARCLARNAAIDDEEESDIEDEEEAESSSDEEWSDDDE
jgi:hypothetical protein